VVAIGYVRRYVENQLVVALRITKV